MVEIKGIGNKALSIRPNDAKPNYVVLESSDSFGFSMRVSVPRAELIKALWPEGVEVVQEAFTDKIMAEDWEAKVDKVLAILAGEVACSTQLLK